MSEALIIGIGSYILAIDPATGSELWRTKLKSTPFVTILPVGGRIFAGAGGELFCLDKATGQILWNNKLPRLGTGFVSLGSALDPAAVAMVAASQAAAAGAVAATVAATAASASR